MSDPEKSTNWYLLRGLARASSHWGKLPEDLAHALSSNVTCLDLPGAGVHHRMKSPILVSEIAEHIRLEFLKHRAAHPAKRAYVLANSLGAMVAVDWLQRYPEDLDGAVLINTSFRSVSPFYKRLSPKAYTHLLKIIREKDLVARERSILEMVSNRPETYDKVSREWAEMQKTQPVSPENFFRQLLAASLFSPAPQAPQIPILLLSSEKDRMVDPSCSPQISRAWNCELRRHPTAGHDLALDDPQWVIENVQNWLGQKSSKSS
jgi:pimeloyl-ACP methyl ester carboxylesterase